MSKWSKTEIRVYSCSFERNEDAPEDDTQWVSWSLTSPQQRLVKTGGRLIEHARYYWLLLAESHLTRRLFGSMLRRIAALPLPAG
jgi:hypothetical protein